MMLFFLSVGLLVLFLLVKEEFLAVSAPGFCFFRSFKNDLFIRTQEASAPPRHLLLQYFNILAIKRDKKTTCTPRREAEFRKMAETGGRGGETGKS